MSTQLSAPAKESEFDRISARVVECIEELTACLEFGGKPLTKPEHDSFIANNIKINESLLKTLKSFLRHKPA